MGKSLQQHPGRFGIQSACRLIRENNFRMVDQCPGTGTALLLSAGYLVGEFVAKGQDIQALHDFFRPFLDLLFAFLCQLHGKGNILLNGQRVEQVEVLEDKSQIVFPEISHFILAEPCDVLGTVIDMA